MNESRPEANAMSSGRNNEEIELNPLPKQSTLEPSEGTLLKTTESGKKAVTPWKDLLERQERLVCRVKAAQCVLKMEREEFGRYSENVEKKAEENGDGDEEEGQCRESDGVCVSQLTNEKEWQNTIRRVMKERKQSIQGQREKKKAMKDLSLHFHDAVSQCVEVMSPSSPEAKPMAVCVQDQEETLNPNSGSN